ncbi:OLC1v1003937C1 [Oldenlandia corymbosa var. corymbosa]|uniref:OLC1v1003937C1 n=1 Tax=Oldenlandia corymbosa var. corymbosa TaxID=529605 RepID=A0AAV1DB60_OLDCO|nr:OLC1v1003937C1 [Oldenlandia corymbosa var. corymbosa]
MEDRCVPLRYLDEKTVEWYTKVILLTKGILVNSKGKAGSLTLSLADKEKTVMQAVIYTKDLNFLEQKLQLYETYYIGNAFITKIEDPKYQYGSVPFQMTLTRKSFIEKVERTKSYHLDECLPITPFWEIDVDPDKENENLSSILHLLCVLHMLPPRTVNAQNGATIVQDFVIINNEIVENKDCAENVIKEKLYEKQKQEVRVPKEKHIRQINQVLNIQHTVKNCWVKATATIKDNQRLYTAICPNCDNPSGAPMGIISTCNYCGTSGKAPKPGLKFVINLADITGTLQAVIQNEYIEKLLRCSADEVYHNHLAGKPVDLRQVNTTLQSQVLYARLRIFKIKESAFGFELTAFTPDQKTCDMMIGDTPTKAVTTPATYPAITSSPSQQGSTTKSQTYVDTPTSVAEDSEYVSVQDAEKKGTAVKRTLTHDIERASKKTRFPPSDQQ